MITIKEAVRMLDLKNNTSLHTTKKYKQFLVRRSGFSGVMFDIHAYMMQKSRDDAFVARCGLFSEFLRYEVGLQYSEMSKDTGVAIAVINRCEFGLGSARKFVGWYVKHRQDLIEAFDRYYDF